MEPREKIMYLSGLVSFVELKACFKKICFMEPLVFCLFVFVFLFSFLFLHSNSAISLFFFFSFHILHIYIGAVFFLIHFLNFIFPFFFFFLFVAALNYISVFTFSFLGIKEDIYVHRMNLVLTMSQSPL